MRRTSVIFVHRHKVVNLLTHLILRETKPGFKLRQPSSNFCTLNTLLPLLVHPPSLGIQLVDAPWLNVFEEVFANHLYIFPDIMHIWRISLGSFLVPSFPVASCLREHLTFHETYWHSASKVRFPDLVEIMTLKSKNKTPSQGALWWDSKKTWPTTKEIWIFHPTIFQPI